MRLAYAIYLGDGPSVLHGDDVKAALDIGDATFGKLSQLVFAEPWFFSGGSGAADDNWDRTIRAEVVLMKDVTDVDGYLDVVARYRFGEPELEIGPGAAEAPPAPSRALAERLRSWPGKQNVSVADLIVIGVITAVMAGVILWCVT